MAHYAKPYKTLKKFSTFSVSIKFANIGFLDKDGNPSIRRVFSTCNGMSIYFRYVAGNLDNLMSQKYVHRCGERLVFTKKVRVNVCGHDAYVYLCIDEAMYLMQHKKTILNALDDKKGFGETDAAIKKLK